MFCSWDDVWSVGIQRFSIWVFVRYGLGSGFMIQVAGLGLEFMVRGFRFQAVGFKYHRSWT